MFYIHIQFSPSIPTKPCEEQPPGFNCRMGDSGILDLYMSMNSHLVGWIPSYYNQIEPISFSRNLLLDVQTGHWQLDVERPGAFPKINGVRELPPGQVWGHGGETLLSEFTMSCYCLNFPWLVELSDDRLPFMTSELLVSPLVSCIHSHCKFFDIEIPVYIPTYSKSFTPDLSVFEPEYDCIMFEYESMWGRRYLSP